MTAEQNMPSPDVSVLIPACNKERQIAEAVRSVLNQTWRNLEVIVADDASTDRTAEIVRELAAADSRLHLVTHAENQGTLRTRLDAFKASSGRYVMCLDADDTLDPGGAEYLLHTAERGAADMVGFGARLLHGGRTIGTIDAVRQTLNGRKIFETAFRHHLYNWSICLKLVRRELFERAAAETENFYCVSAEDFYFYTILSFYAERLFLCGKIFYNYRISDGLTGETSPESFRRFATLLDALQAVRLFLEAKNMAGTFGDAFEMREREHFRMLLERFPGTAEALTLLTEKYEPEKVRQYLAEFYSSEYAESAFNALTRGEALPARPESRSAEQSSPSAGKRLERFIRPESALWFLLKRITDRVRWRKYV